MENTQNQIEITQSQKDCQIANRLISLYMSRQRCISESGEVVESNSYTEPERAQQAGVITTLLTTNVDEQKAAIIEEVLRCETRMQKTEMHNVDNVERVVTYEVVVSAFDGVCRPIMTTALSAFLISQAQENLTAKV